MDNPSYHPFHILVLLALGSTLAVSLHVYPKRSVHLQPSRKCEHHRGGFSRLDAKWIPWGGCWSKPNCHTEGTNILSQGDMELLTWHSVYLSTEYGWELGHDLVSCWNSVAVCLGAAHWEKLKTCPPSIVSPL